MRVYVITPYMIHWLLLWCFDLYFNKQMHGAGVPFHIGKVEAWFFMMMPLFYTIDCCLGYPIGKYQASLNLFEQFALTLCIPIFFLPFYF